MKQVKINLRFRIEEINKYSRRYEYKIKDDEILDSIEIIKKRRYLKKNELYNLAYWKAPRSSGNIQKNDEMYIKEITKFALKSNNERARIESLTLLDGVSWPTASVILHFYHDEPYPILDFRAIWSVSLELPSKNNFEFWWNYVKYCRELAEKAKVDMRTLDKALWQYSKENQKK